MDGDRRWELVRLDDDHWLVCDLRYPQDDARCMIACVTESEDGVDVFWTARDIPLPTRYLEAADVIDDLIRWSRARPPHSRPIEIAHAPPFSAGRQRHDGAGIGTGANVKSPRHPTARA